MGSTDVHVTNNPLNVHADVGPIAVTPIAVSSVGPVGPVTVALPDPLHIDIDKLATIHLAVDSIPKIQLGVDPIELRLTEFPSIRGHLPADFSVGLSVLGMDLLCVRLCGEAQIITEPYKPNPCEVCAQPSDVGREHAAVTV